MAGPPPSPRAGNLPVSPGPGGRGLHGSRGAGAHRPPRDQPPRVVGIAEHALRRVFVRTSPQLVPPEERRPVSNTKVQCVDIACCLFKLTPCPRDRGGRVVSMSDKVHQPPTRPPPPLPPPTPPHPPAPPP